MPLTNYNSVLDKRVATPTPARDHGYKSSEQNSSRPKTKTEVRRHTLHKFDPSVFAQSKGAPSAKDLRMKNALNRTALGTISPPGESVPFATIAANRTGHEGATVISRNKHKANNRTISVAAPYANAGKTNNSMDRTGNGFNSSGGPYQGKEFQSIRSMSAFHFNPEKRIETLK